jgi:vacuolar-type H+-ATPase subunit I/STV1
MEQHNCIQIAEIATLKSEVSNIKTQIIEFKDVGAAVIELSTIQRQNQQRDEERDKDRKEQSKLVQQQTYTLEKINDNLELMGSEIKATNARIDKLENKFNQSEEIFKVDTRIVVKNFISKHWYKLVIVGIGIYEALKATKIV